jgi:hypothetical protein
MVACEAVTHRKTIAKARLKIFHILVPQGSSFDRLRTSGTCPLMVSLSNHERACFHLQGVPHHSLGDRKSHLGPHSPEGFNARTYRNNVA